jgi:hypothetical protein
MKGKEKGVFLKQKLAIVEVCQAGQMVTSLAYADVYEEASVFLDLRLPNVG